MFDRKNDNTHIFGVVYFNVYLLIILTTDKSK